MFFNINDYKGNFVMHCKTEEESISFLNYLDNLGFKRPFGERPITLINNYLSRSDMTCYNFNNPNGLTYDTIEYYKRRYIILEWSNFMNNKSFTKSDLKEGMIVEYRNGEQKIVVGDSLFSIGLAKKQEPQCTGNLINYNIDLTKKQEFRLIPSEPYDIMKVYKLYDYGQQKIVFDRDAAEEMTLDQICKELGREIKIIR